MERFQRQAGMTVDVTRGNAALHIEKILARGTLAKADVFVAMLQGRRYVVKDFSSKGFWERNLIGRLFIFREFRAYRALSGVKGLPERFVRLSPFTLAIEYLEGRSLGAMMKDDIGPSVIGQLEGIIQDIHRRGWVHLDLHRRNNILLVDGKVIAVDLASAFHPGGVPLIGRWLTRFLGFFDGLSLVKLKKVYAPEMLSASEKRILRLRNRVMPRKW